MQTLTETITMSDACKLVLHSWLPEKEPEILVFLNHGMAEHSSRYAHVAQKFTENNIALFAHDMRGHGESCPDDENLGFFCKKDGYRRTERKHKL